MQKQRWKVHRYTMEIFLFCFFFGGAILFALATGTTISCRLDRQYRLAKEAILKKDDQYSRHPCPNEFRSAAAHSKTILCSSFTKQAVLMWRSTVLCLPLLKEFPSLFFFMEKGHWTMRYHTVYWSLQQRWSEILPCLLMFTLTSRELTHWTKNCSNLS